MWGMKNKKPKILPDLDLKAIIDASSKIWFSLTIVMSGSSAMVDLFWISLAGTMIDGWY